VLTEAAILCFADEATSDEELVALIIARRKDQFLFSHLYQRYHAKTFALAYGMAGCRARAEDMTQEIFLRAYERLETFHGQASFATWFYRLAVNCCLNHCRRERAQRRVANIDEADAPLVSVNGDEEIEQIVLQRQIQRQVRQALLSLNPQMRLLIVMKGIENLSYAEMAERLECSTGTVASKLNRARRLLARKLESLKGKI
jgi:RNA polymerase sigma-70 factor (ECF subfamily)